MPDFMIIANSYGRNEVIVDFVLTEFRLKSRSSGNHVKSRMSVNIS